MPCEVTVDRGLLPPTSTPLAMIALQISLPDACLLISLSYATAASRIRNDLSRFVEPRRLLDGRSELTVGQERIIISGFNDRPVPMECSEGTGFTGSAALPFDHSTSPYPSSVSSNFPDALRAAPTVAAGFLPRTSAPLFDSDRPLIDCSYPFCRFRFKTDLNGFNDVGPIAHRSTAIGLIPFLHGRSMV